jgi:hypothetical protein
MSAGQAHSDKPMPVFSNTVTLDTGTGTRNNNREGDGSILHTIEKLEVSNYQRVYCSLLV